MDTQCIKMYFMTSITKWKGEALRDRVFTHNLLVKYASV